MTILLRGYLACRATPKASMCCHRLSRHKSTRQRMKGDPGDVLGPCLRCFRVLRHAQAAMSAMLLLKWGRRHCTQARGLIGAYSASNHNRRSRVMFPLSMYFGVSISLLFRLQPPRRADISHERQGVAMNHGPRSATVLNVEEPNVGQFSELGPGEHQLLQKDGAKKKRSPSCPIQTDAALVAAEHAAGSSDRSHSSRSARGHEGMIARRGGLSMRALSRSVDTPVFVVHKIQCGNAYTSQQECAPVYLWHA